MIERGFMLGVLGRSVPKIQASITSAHGYGAKLFRYPIVGSQAQINSWTIPQYNQFLQNELDKFTQVISICTQIPVKLILDIHHPIGGVEPHPTWGWKTKLFYTDTLKQEFIRQWKDIATRYKNMPCVLGYDLMNEPLATTQQWKPLVVSLVKEIRKVDKNKKIIIETRFGGADQVSSLPVLKDKNIWYSVHIYYPQRIAFQGMPDAQCKIQFPIKNVRVKKEVLYAFVKKLREFQIKNKAKIYIGEFSTARWAIGGNILLKQWMNIFKEYGWHWTYHAFDEAPIWNPLMDAVPCSNPCVINCKGEASTKRIDLIKRYL